MAAGDAAAASARPPSEEGEGDVAAPQRFDDDIDVRVDMVAVDKEENVLDNKELRALMGGRGRCTVRRDGGRWGGRRRWGRGTTLLPLSKPY